MRSIHLLVRSARLWNTVRDRRRGGSEATSNRSRSSVVSRDHCTIVQLCALCKWLESLIFVLFLRKSLKTFSVDIAIAMTAASYLQSADE
jgi:hypothetical protein